MRGKEVVKADGTTRREARKAGNEHDRQTG